MLTKDNYNYFFFVKNFNFILYFWKLKIYYFFYNIQLPIFFKNNIATKIVTLKLTSKTYFSALILKKSIFLKYNFTNIVISQTIYKKFFIRFFFKNFFFFYFSNFFFSIQKIFFCYKNSFDPFYKFLFKNFKNKNISITNIFTLLN